MAVSMGFKCDGSAIRVQILPPSLSSLVILEVNFFVLLLLFFFFLNVFIYLAGLGLGCSVWDLVP